MAGVIKRIEQYAFHQADCPAIQPRIQSVVLRNSDEQMRASSKVPCYNVWSQPLFHRSANIIIRFGTSPAGMIEITFRVATSIADTDLAPEFDT